VASASAMHRYLEKCQDLLQRIGQQAAAIARAADWCAESIASGRVVHLFGSGHSRIMVEEMWPRYGSFPGFNPIVELSLTYHNLVVGCNGQRQAMFLENVPGLAARILRNFHLDRRDTAVIVSNSGCNVVPIEMAHIFREHGVRTIAVVSFQHALRSRSQHPTGGKLHEVCDMALDTGAPPGDAMVALPGLAVPVAPGSTIGGCLIVNCLKVEIAQRLIAAGVMPPVLTSAVLVGEPVAQQSFESAYDEHARRLAAVLMRGDVRGAAAEPAL